MSVNLPTYATHFFTRINPRTFACVRRSLVFFFLRPRRSLDVCFFCTLAGFDHNLRGSLTETEPQQMLLFLAEKKYLRKPTEDMENNLSDLAFWSQNRHSAGGGAPESVLRSVFPASCCREKWSELLTHKRGICGGAHWRREFLSHCKRPSHLHGKKKPVHLF